MGPQDISVSTCTLYIEKSAVFSFFFPNLFSALNFQRTLPQGQPWNITKCWQPEIKWKTFRQKELTIGQNDLLAQWVSYQITDRILGKLGDAEREVKVKKVKVT